jgi:hypothetical protein
VNRLQQLHPVASSALLLLMARLPVGDGIGSKQRLCGKACEEKHVRKGM